MDATARNSAQGRVLAGDGVQVLDLMCILERIANGEIEPGEKFQTTRGDINFQILEGRSTEVDYSNGETGQELA